MDSLIHDISHIIESNLYLAPILALLGGILTSLSPCCLSTIPLIIGYVGKDNNDTKKSFVLSVLFALGMTMTFTILGVVASLFGRILNINSNLWYIILGTIMVLMALQVWEVFSFVPSSYAVSKNKKIGYVGAFFAGALGGLFSSPCSTPILVVILAFVAKEGSLLYGTLLLLLYSIGHSILLIIVGTSTSTLRKITNSSNYGALSNVLKVSTGLIILILGFYMLYLGF